MNKSTEILISNLDESNRRLQKLQTDTLLVVVDESVWSFHLDRIERLLSLSDKRVIKYLVPSGESAKTVKSLNAVLEHFASAGVHRNAVLVSIGGGATSDLAGLVAHLLLRGIRWIVIPTTILSMVDAAYGGKVAVNSQSEKNLFGAFHFPEAVWVDSAFLLTLPFEQHQSGWGEVIKYAFLHPPIMEYLRQPRREITSEKLFLMALHYKAHLVSEDPFDKGVRQILNLGHTFGHVIETSFNLPHGIAVFWGMYLLFYFEKRQDLLSQLIVLKKQSPLEDLVPPWHTQHFDRECFVKHLLMDKKRASNATVSLISLDDNARAFLKTISVDLFNTRLLEVWNDLSLHR